MRVSATVFGALLLLDSSVPVVSQDRSTPQSSFRTGVELVYVDVSVLDSDRRPVRGLEASDFVVREDGRPQADRGVQRGGPARSSGRIARGLDEGCGSGCRHEPDAS